MTQKIDESKLRKLGVKKKPEELRRTVSLSFSPQEFIELDALAESYKLSRSEFVRCIVFGNIDKAARKVALIEVAEHEKQLKRILASISNNLNQITRRIHISDTNKLNIDEAARLAEEFKAILKG